MHLHPAQNCWLKRGYCWRMPKWRYFIILLCILGVPPNTVTESCEARELGGAKTESGGVIRFSTRSPEV